MDLHMDEDTSIAWRNRIDALERRRTALTSKYDAARHAQREHALKAALGDASACASMADAAAHITEAERQLHEISLAIAAAGEGLSSALRAEAASNRAVQVLELRRLLSDRAAAAHRIESGLIQIAKAIERIEATERRIADLVQEVEPDRAAGFEFRHAWPKMNETLGQRFSERMRSLGLLRLCDHNAGGLIARRDTFSDLDAEDMKLFQPSEDRSSGESTGLINEHKGVEAPAG